MLNYSNFFLQMNNRHEDGDKPWINLQLHTREGAVAHVSGVTAGIPLLIAVNGATFSSPASLHGNSILFRSKPNPQILPQIISECALTDHSMGRNFYLDAIEF